MKCLTVALLLMCTLPAFAQTLEPVPNAVAQQLLLGLMPQGQKTVTVTTFVANTSVSDVNLGTYCSSSSSGDTTGTVDDDGTISAKTNSSGNTNCSERHVYHDTMILGFDDKANPGDSYLLTAVCTERFVWNHCGMPTKGSTYPLVIETDKSGRKFTIYVATSDRIGGKPKVAKFAIVQLTHVKNQPQNP